MFLFSPQRYNFICMQINGDFFAILVERTRRRRYRLEGRGERREARGYRLWARGYRLWAIGERGEVRGER